MTNGMRLHHAHHLPITQPSHHHRHGLDTLPALHPGGEPGAREAQAEPEPAPSSPRQSTPSRGQQEPGENQHQRTQGKASTQQSQRGHKASRKRQHPTSTGNRERLHPCRASTQPNTRASPTACTQGADDLERERGEKRGSAQKITALQRRPAPAPDEATAQALHPCRQPSQHPRPDGQPWRAPSARGFNSAFVEYAEPALNNAAHAIPGEKKQGGRFTF